MGQALMAQLLGSLDLRLAEGQSALGSPESAAAALLRDAAAPVRDGGEERCGEHQRVVGFPFWGFGRAEEAREWGDG